MPRSYEILSKVVSEYKKLGKIRHDVDTNVLAQVLTSCIIGLESLVLEDETLLISECRKQIAEIYRWIRVK